MVVAYVIGFGKALKGQPQQLSMPFLLG